VEKVFKKLDSVAIKISLIEDENEIGRAFLYIIKNDLHKSPYGLMEDVFVYESRRKQGLGRELVNLVVDEAKKQGCYKLVATSRSEREKVHELYKKLGFNEHGKEFRMELKNPD
jgi:GNAT superfamily N-acetyltransferase